jgi:hypothetical protein
MKEGLNYLVCVDAIHCALHNILHLDHFGRHELAWGRMIRLHVYDCNPRRGPLIETWPTNI